MNIYRPMNMLYGQLRGHGRLRIRREAARLAGASPEWLRGQQRDLFRQQVAHCLATFPVYGETVGEAFGDEVPDIAGLRSEDWPVWIREDQRQLFSSLNGSPVPNSFVHSTGGSTGVPTKFYVTRESYEWRCAVSDRGYSWAGAEEGRRSFYVWGTPINSPAWRKRMITGLHHRLQRRTYFDSFHFGDEQKAQCCRAINRLQPPVIVGYAGNLVELAHFVRDNPGQLKWRAARLVTAAEGLRPGCRELLAEHLGDEVFMSYGSREFMLIGMECLQHRGYHISADNLLVEVVDDDDNVLPPGETGRILVTDLRNTANPFIRYEIGDLGAMGDPAAPCPCGLPFPILSRVEGRLQEVIHLPTGDKLTALFIPHLMKEFEWVEGYQLLQADSHAVTVNIVAREWPTPDRIAPIEHALREKVGNGIEIRFRKVETLTKTRSGKVPIVVQNATSGSGRNA